MASSSPSRPEKAAAASPVNARCPCSAPGLQGAGGLPRRRSQPERLPPKITAAEARTVLIAPAPTLHNRAPRPLSTCPRQNPNLNNHDSLNSSPALPTTHHPQQIPKHHQPQTPISDSFNTTKQPLSPSTPKHPNTTNLHFIMLAFGQRRKPPPNRSGKPKGCESQIRPFVRSPNAPIFGLRSCNPLPFPARFALRNSAVQLADDPAQLGPVVPRPDAPHGPRA